jgi:RNA polymerase sigma-70 factor (ECF subfamily)
VVRLLLQDALNDTDPLGRKVLMLRRFDELSNVEVAQVLGLTKTAASNRYVRTLERLRVLLADIPGVLIPWEKIRSRARGMNHVSGWLQRRP